MTDHERYRDDIGAYLLDALDERERSDFERHLAACDECGEAAELLRPAAEALPGSVEQVEPPPRLKTALMGEVERDAAAAGRAERPRLLTRPWLPRLALGAAVLLLGLAIGFGLSQLGGEDTRTLQAMVDPAMPDAGGSLRISDDHATLRLHDMPDVGPRRVYQVWLQHGDELAPARTFEVGTSGTGEVEVRGVDDADGVYVTREPRGGAKVPSETPIVSVPL
jgi:hypothetical protein